jgi:hypothetical protein
MPVLTLAAYTSGLTLYWASESHWTALKARFLLTAAAALALHAVLVLWTGGAPVLNLLVVLPGLTVLAAAWIKRRR